MNKQPESHYFEVAPPIELVIFDCDGVLVDSEMICLELLLRELKKVGVEVCIDYFYQHFLGRSFDNVRRKILDIFDVVLTDDFESSYLQHLLQNFETKLQPTTGVKHVLKYLRTPYCVATSSSPKRTEKALELTGLNEFFNGNVFTASQVEKGKPAPDLFLFAADKMGVKPENCLVIEDSVSGVEAAQAAGMLVWQYAGGSHMAEDNPHCASQYSTKVRFSSWHNFDKMIAITKHSELA